MTYHAFKNNQSRILELEKNIEKLSVQEEIHWKQRAMVNWLNRGDPKTKYFHALAYAQCQNNFIKGPLNRNGEWCSDDTSLVNITAYYFSSLFSSSNPSPQDIETVLDFVGLMVENDMNDALCVPLTAEEIQKAVFDMHRQKHQDRMVSQICFIRNFG